MAERSASRQPAVAAAPRLVVARYGELWLKGRNRGHFAKILRRNARMALRSFPGVRLERLHGQLVVHAPERCEEVLERLRGVFGFTSLSPAWRVAADPDAIAALASALVARALEERPPGPPLAFRVTTRRVDKSFPLTSVALDRSVGERVLEDHGARLRVDLTRAQLELGIVVRPEATYVFRERLAGAGGLPVGSLGRVVCLLSGGIDSPVAAWCAMKRGCHVSLVSFHSAPYLGEASREKIRRLAQVLARWQRASRLYSVPFARVQEAIRERCDEGYRTILYRRMMQRIAGRIARAEHALALVTGESVGQVASQTLENLRCIEDASELPVLRPLVTYDKLETIELARRIGTFDVSRLDAPDCCTVFQPAAPVIHGRVGRCRAEEETLDVEALVREAVASTSLERFVG